MGGEGWVKDKWWQKARGKIMVEMERSREMDDKVFQDEVIIMGFVSFKILKVKVPNVKKFKFCMKRFQKDLRQHDNDFCHKCVRAREKCIVCLHMSVCLRMCKHPYDSVCAKRQWREDEGGKEVWLSDDLEFCLREIEH